MSIPEQVRRLVWVRAGGRCAFQDCRRPLIERGPGAAVGDPDAQIGEVAHIVGRSEERGPRSTFEVPGGERNGVGNLMLLCPSCHAIVDRQPQTYTVERLLGIKESHERWVQERLHAEPPAPLELVREELHSTFMVVDQMPRYVYTAPCLLSEPDVRGCIRWPRDRDVMLPFVVQDKKLISFWPLTEANGPFADAIDEQGAAERFESVEWWRDPVLSRWYVMLLNRALNKLTGRRGLQLDKAHARYYFEPERGPVDEAPAEPDGRGSAPRGVALPREVKYRPLTNAESTRNAVWQPVRRKTGEPRGHWIHLAVGLRFHRVSPIQWVLSVRPEHRFTVDGFEPLHPKGISRRATSKKSHMYNPELLADLQFWRDYLSEGKPNIILQFGGQSLVIDAQFARMPIEWPGVRGDAIAYGNAVVEHDLFTSAEYHDALDNGEGDEDASSDWHDDAELNDNEAEDWNAVLEEEQESREDVA